MGTEITDTEHAAPTMKRADLGGLKFRVPPSPTLAYMFWMRGFISKFGDGSLVDDDIADCYEQTVEFLEQFNSKVDRATLEKQATLADLITFYTRCYGADSELEDEESKPTVRRGTGGNRRTSRQSRS